MTDKEKIEKAIKIAWQYAQYDGSHHKMWVIDQMVRVLLGETEYKNFIDAYQTPDGEDYYTAYGASQRPVLRSKTAEMRS